MHPLDLPQKVGDDLAEARLQWVERRNEWKMRKRGQLLSPSPPPKRPASNVTSSTNLL